MYKTPKEHTAQRELYRKKDLPIDAVFTSKFKSLHILLMKVLSYMGPEGRERDEDSGFRVRFTDGLYRTRSSALVKRLLSGSERSRGLIWPDPNDPSGFWRKTCGAELKIETRKVLEIKNLGLIVADDIDLDKLKNVDPKAPVTPLVVLETLPAAPKLEPVES